MKFQTLQNAFFLGTLALTTFLLLWLLSNFIMTIFWAIILGVVFYPVYKYLLKKFKNRKNPASFVTLLLILVLFFAPMYGVGSLVADEAITFYNQLEIGEGMIDISTYSQSIVAVFSTFGFEISESELQTRGIEIAKTTSAVIASSALDFGRATTGAVIQFFLMLYLLFFVFRDGAHLGKRLMDTLPLGNKKEKELFNKFTSIIRAIFKGTLVIALVQGSLGALTLWAAGVDNLLLLAVVMTILAIIPALGPAIILAPVALFLLFTGSIVPGIIVLVGLVVVSVVDNLLRPALVGREIQMHDVLIMLSIFGGLATFGFTGFVIGPVIMGVFILMWEMFEDQYKKDLGTQG